MYQNRGKWHDMTLEMFIFIHQNSLLNMSEFKLCICKPMILLEAPITLNNKDNVFV